MDGQGAGNAEKNICMGLLAHVDAGKTTFCEQLLCRAGAIRQPGRVDHGSTVMDTDPIERQRGITIFAGQGFFEYQGVSCYLLDTPGHVDFCAEAERAAAVLDYGLILLDATKEAAAHAVTLFKLLERQNIPAFFFINKMDLEGASLQRVMDSVRERMTKDVFLLRPGCGLAQDGGLDFSGPLGEFAAERDEGLLEAYLEGGISREEGTRVLAELVRQRKAYLAMAGSALKDEGIGEFLKVFCCLGKTDCHREGALKARVYKIRHDSKGRRLVFARILSGSLKVKDEVLAGWDSEGEPVREKVNELFFVQGDRYIPVPQAQAGSLAAFCGPRLPVCGSLIGGEPGQEQEYRFVPVLESRAVPLGKTGPAGLLSALKILEDEEPQLHVRSSRLPDGSEQICAGVMGKVQLEVLKELLKERFGIEADFQPPRVLYRETLLEPVTGCGHYEPLRHYAEVILRLEPGEEGSGVTFESRCHVDRLGANYQSLIASHVMERDHRGVLTGSPLTDVKVILLDGRAHLKHTEGGDFRQAVYRAIRHGLEKARDKCRLLEPWYEFEITAPAQNGGRILADIQKRSGQARPPVRLGDQVVICGMAPAAAFMDYAQELASLTRGLGSVSMVNGGFKPCHNEAQAIEACGYDSGADTTNPASSVFCSHGAGYTVSWQEAEGLMHCLKDPA